MSVNAGPDQALEAEAFGGGGSATVYRSRLAAAARSAAAAAGAGSLPDSAVEEAGAGADAPAQAAASAEPATAPSASPGAAELSGSTLVFPATCAATAAGLSSGRSGSRTSSCFSGLACPSQQRIFPDRTICLIPQTRRRLAQRQWPSSMQLQLLRPWATQRLRQRRCTGCRRSLCRRPCLRKQVPSAYSCCSHAVVISETSCTPVPAVIVTSAQQQDRGCCLSFSTANVKLHCAVIVHSTCLPKPPHSRAQTLLQPAHRARQESKGPHKGLQS